MDKDNIINELKLFFNLEPDWDLYYNNQSYQYYIDMQILCMKFLISSINFKKEEK